MNEMPPRDDLPPLPDSFFIPQATIDRWFGIPPDHRVELSITRGELDQLFFAISKSVNAQSQFRQSMISWTQGNLDAANRLNRLAAQQEIESLNALRMFFNAVMAGAKPLERP